jgi:pimeloyl-ACP methyl ester carboxylesterase
VLAQHIPGAKTAVIPGARHWIFDQAPQQYSDAVKEFLAA